MSNLNEDIIICDITLQRYLELEDLPNEEWKPVENYEGIYSVSNMGRVRSEERYTNCRGNSKRLLKAKILKPNKIGNMHLLKLGASSIYLHKLVAKAFLNIDYEERVEFKNGNRNDCRLENIKSIHSFKERVPVEFKNGVIEGGFGEGQRILFDIQLAEICEYKNNAYAIRHVVASHKEAFTSEHIIDIAKASNIRELLPILHQVGYTDVMIKQSISQGSIYIFSERGADLFVSLMQNSPKKIELVKQRINEYYGMRKIIKEQLPQISAEDKAILNIIHSNDTVSQALAIKEYKKLITTPLIETINEQAPKVDVYEKFIKSDNLFKPTSMAKLFDLGSAQEMNKVLHKLHLQYKQGNKWFPYTNVDNSWYKMVITSDYGEQLRWTSIGVVEIAKLLDIVINEEEIVELSD